MAGSNVVLKFWGEDKQAENFRFRRPNQQQTVPRQIPKFSDKVL